ncbi:MAG: hypothetical protein II850_07635 [Fibrobacter sp.]|uniref:hypothetical protein n=1 Tax=Fibrobacter sp. TaxID=35828 RepID=UPI0025C2AC6D|nr:hypothetical protein [Fibrobacter sp.]MBQ3720837.1 hypothetical protein [Fibrobacter sp.]MBR4009109.1 hypothetical protein [Fibrobacter sp.]
MAGKGADRATMARIGKKTRLKKNDPRSRAISSKGVAVRKAQAELRSSDAILEADRNGTLANLFSKMVEAANGLFEQGKYDSFLKHGAGILEMVNGKQINIKADANVKRDIIINFRRATPEDAK